MCFSSFFPGDHRRRLSLIIVTLVGGCSAPSGAPTPVSSRIKRTVSTTLSLEADAAVVQRVQAVGELPGSPLPLIAERPGHWKLRVDGLVPGRSYRYRFRFFRRDLGRWLTISDPRARLLDASSRRHGLLQAGTPPPTPPPPLARMPAVREMIIYELCPREFVDSAVPYAHPSRDPGARGPGKVLQKITAKIRSGYFEKLGVNVLQLMPITASGWTRHKRKLNERDPWGYIPISWYALNGDYGSPRDLVELVTEAHRRGMAVLLDYSLDHGYGGSRHGLITDLFPAWRNPRPKNRWGLLELNVQRPELRAFMMGALRRFLVDYGIDGFRMDWTENVPWQTWKPYLEQIRRIKPGAVVITENPVKELVARAGFHSAWDFFFQWEAPLLLRRNWTNWDGVGQVKADTLHKLVENLTTWKAGPHAPPGPLVRYIESHDLPRIARPTVRWQHGGDQLMDADGDGKTPDVLDYGGPRSSRLGAVLLATVPGAVMIFAGQEFGADDDLFWGYDPLNWKAFDRATFDHYRRLLQLRRKTGALRSDDLHVQISDSERHLLVYSRGMDPGRTDEDTVVVALNFGGKLLREVKITLPAEGDWKDLLSGKLLPRGLQQKVDLPPSGWVVWGKSTQ